MSAARGAAASRRGSLQGRRVRALALAAVVTWLGAGCGTRRTDLNVLLLTLDTTRADRFGAWGNSDGLTPHFDAFGAARAVRFARALTAVPVTFPSHSTILTGTYPVFHGVHDNDGYRLDDGVTTLAEILGGRGYRTAAFLAAYPLSSQLNLDQGFELYDDDFQADWTEAELRGRTALAFGFLERKSDRVNLAFSRWFERLGNERFFAWVHYFDPHQPYDPPRPYDTQFSDSPYDGEVAFMDENFGKLVEMLESRDLLDRTLIVIVGDHGESLGQHGEPTHASYVYDATMHVPLWIAWPGVGGGRSVETTVRTLDIAPTVLDILGLPVGPEMQGATLVPLLRDAAQEPAREAMLESYYPWFQFGWAPVRALQSGSWKYIEAPRPELYDVVADPEEIHNRVAQQPERAREMRERLYRLTREASAGDLGRSVVASSDPELQQKLLALGYVSGGASAAQRAAPFPAPEELTGWPNPASMALVLHYLNFSNELLRKTLVHESLSVAREGLHIDPGNYRLMLQAARAQALLGLLDEALAQIERAKARLPDEPSAWSLEGRVHLARGEHALAAAELVEALERGAAPAEVLPLLASAYGALGRHDEAVEHLEAALAEEGPSWNLCAELANALVAAGRYEEARERYQQALDLNPYSPAVRYYVAQFARRAGNPDFAIEMFRSVVQLSPTHVGAHTLLAEVLLERGRPEEAAQHLRAVLQLAPTSAWAERARGLLATHGLDADGGS